MTRASASYATLAGRAAYAPAGRPLSSLVVEMALTWLERVRQRRHLAQLSDHMLKDIGLSRAEVEAEVAKPFWRD